MEATTGAHVSPPVDVLVPCNAFHCSPLQVEVFERG